MFPNPAGTNSFNTPDRFFSRMLYPNGVELLYFASLNERLRYGRVEDHQDVTPEQVQWLARTLAADTTTPTVVVWHYPFYNEGGLSSSGRKLGRAAARQDVWDLLKAAPNVVATFNGHTHWNSADRRDGITCIQNAAYVEWPNMYRVFRVYADRMEWEVRLTNSQGFVRESFVPQKALSWMISTRGRDLAGQVRLTRSGR